ncbi:MAG TPA: YhjD/YihY/BrkB family envelope integrity protein [Gaiellaceae bacterium]|nr:YhjD/YihY/BrkB family envelope integrity protein [Gaiellaceae bacterium]
MLRRSWDRVRAFGERYGRLNGRNTAAAITLYGFLALFALTVLATGVIGFISEKGDDVAASIVNWLGVEGTAAKTVTDAVKTAQQSATVATVVGLAGLIWIGSSFALAVASAYDTAWQVPTRSTRSRLVGLGWLVGAFVLLGTGAFLTSLFSSLPVLLVVVTLVISLSVDTGLWIWTSWVLPNRRLPVRAMLVPAAAGAVGLELLKVLGGYVVPRLVASSSALYGAIGVVFALIAWLWVFGRLVVGITVLEVTRWEAEHGTVERTVEAPVTPR